MKVKNISGGTLTFQAGNYSHTLDNNTTVTLEDTDKALNDVITHVQKGRLEIVTLPPSSQYVGTPATKGYAIIQLESDLVDTDTLTIGSVTFEIDEAADGVVGSNIAVTAADATDNAVTAAGLKAAINANATLDALGLKVNDIIDLGVDDQRLILEAEGDTLIGDVTISQTGDGIAITKVNAAVSAGFRESVIKVTAGAATAIVNTGLEECYDATVLVRTAAGVRKAYDGAVTIGGKFIYISDSGSTDIADTDELIIHAYGK